MKQKQSEDRKKSSSKFKDSLLNGLKGIIFPVSAVIFALFVSVFFVMWAKHLGFAESASLLFSSLWKGSFGTKFNFMETLVFTTPLIFTGLAHSLAFKTGLFNIGVEGQFIIGMITAALVGQIPGIPHILHILLIIATGMIAGGIWAGIPGYLKAKLGTNEVVNSIMMNFIGMYLSNYLVMGPFRKPGTASTQLIQDSAKLTRFVSPNDRVNTALFIGIGFAILVYILLWKTTTGYELRAVGLNPDAAEYGGISINKNIILAMALSGALAGLGGATHISGIQHQANQLFGFPNFGFDGITVALVAKSNPIGVIFSALLFGALNYSSAGLQVVGIPSQIASLIQGIVILFIAAEYGFKIIGAKISAKRKKGAVVNE